MQRKERKIKEYKCENHLIVCIDTYCMSVFCDFAVLARLVSDLQAFLLVLDSENLSYIAQAQKKSITELLYKLQDNKDAPGDRLII